MMPSQGKSRDEAISAEQKLTVQNNLEEVLNTSSRVNVSVIEGVTERPSTPICLIDAFRQSWETRWLDRLPKKEEIKDSRTVTRDVTELVCADLLNGSRYTKDAWSMPKNYEESILVYLNAVFAPTELEVASICHKQRQVESRNGFLDGLLRAKEIANHVGEYAHSFQVRVRSIHHIQLRRDEDERDYNSRQSEIENAKSRAQEYGIYDSFGP